MSSRSKGLRIAMNGRNPNRIGKKGGEGDALDLPLAMSIAAFVAQKGFTGYECYLIDGGGSVAPYRK
ncbi:CPR5 protein [Artemisia annua]|uniref:CPR5 protein n=1 Tax=Artemisia annua TaxID=35608 RepID=A0A2U1LQY7_ARTAN|nr:CPR5 protein [Artemisia annua]